MPRIARCPFAAVVPAILLGLSAVTATGQSTPRDFRIEVRDNSGRPIPEAQISFFLTGDSVRTDSSGVAKITVLADTAINITVRKIGFEPRNARFKLGPAPAFNVRVSLGDVGQRLAEVEVKDSYPGEPWRPGFEQRKKRGGGQFRDIAYFPGGVPFSLNDWFNGLRGIRTGGGGGSEIEVTRCRSLGVWVDGQHVTSPGSGYRSALRSVPAQDIAALELHTTNTPAQFTGQNEDCSLLIWTRRR
jgi:hypothetical protein